MNPEELGAVALREAYLTRRLSPLEVVQAALDRIDRVDSDVGAFRWVDAEGALEEAHDCTEELADGRLRGPLHGIPVGIKELFDVAGATGDYGSEVLAGRVPEEDARAVTKLREAGAIVLGTTRAHEFGWGITTQNARLGSTKNPWDLNRVPGGSSGGSGAALAARMVPLALGSDTGGSIRIPSVFCGVTGLKPTHGRISLRGGVPLSPSMDHAGPMAREVQDLAVALEVLAGPDDPEDPAVMLATLPPVSPFSRGREELEIVTCPDLHLVPLASEHAKAFDAAMERLSGIAHVREANLDGADEIYDTFTAIQQAEAYNVHASQLGTFPQQADSYGEDVRRRIRNAGRVTIQEYLDATRRAAGIRSRFASLLQGEVVLVTPAAACGPSTTADPDSVTIDGADRPLREAVMPYTVPQDLAGLPVCVVPIGCDDENLPMGIQLTAARGREDLVLQAAQSVQQMFRDDMPSGPPAAGTVARSN